MEIGTFGTAAAVAPAFCAATALLPSLLRRGSREGRKEGADADAGAAGNYDVFPAERRQESSRLSQCRKLANFVLQQQGTYKLVKS